jgi:AmmeMemoRadiSam system protein A
MGVQIFSVVAPHPPILVPGVGGRRAQTAHDTLAALSEAQQALANFGPDAIVLMSPHAPAMADAIAVDDSEVLAGSLSQFGDATQYRWPGDPSLAHRLVAEMETLGLPAVARSSDPRIRPGWLDHGTIVPLHFLEPTMRVPLVVVSLSFLPYERHALVGEALAATATATGRRIAFVASGDLSHRLTPDAPAGYSPRAQALDDAIVGVFRSGHLDELARIDPSLVESGGECGLRSFVALSGITGAETVPVRVLSYEGPWGVGYLTALVGRESIEACDGRQLTVAKGRKGGTAGSDESEIVSLARSSIESYVRDHVRLQSPILSTNGLPERAGAFVSLHRDGQLRGCIGTILPTRESLAQEVSDNAIEAATKDPRFPPILESELDDLEIKVDVLREPESCSIEELDPKKYGVIASSGWRRGLLLPDLEGVDDVRTQVMIAMQKAGIEPGEPCSYERFKVDRYT